MPNPKARRSLAILNLLGLYILLQVLWWGYLLISVTRDLASMRGSDDSGLRQALMIAGEGTVFLILLFIGFRTIRRTVRRELHLAGMQRTFLLAVTHELKTPVAAVKLMLETLNSREMSDEQRRKLVADALKETNRLEGLTGNILLATRLEQGQDQGELTSTDLSTMLLGETTRFANLYQSQRTVTHSIQPEVVVSGEPELLRAVCFNLVENAIKYTPPGGHVSVDLHLEGEEAVITVSDNGAGIPDEEKERIFTKFYRSGNEQVRRHKGTGLGLYIVASSLRLHHGRIEVSDNRPQGSTFTARLPLHDASSR
ncbi:MAG: sensor histidine kinase [Flavobacteriales bacterium]